MSNIGSVRSGGVIHTNPLYQPPVDTTPAPAVKDLKSSRSLLSGAELMQRMGAPPKTDVTLFGRSIKTNSAAYKSALEGLQAYQRSAGEQKDGNQVGNLKGQLNKIIQAADDYQTKHATAEGKTDRRGVMGELKAMAQAELANLDELDTLKNTAGKNLTVGEGLALLRGGVRDASMFNRDLSDSPIDAAKSKLEFGAGKVNVVSLIAFDGGNTMRVVKTVHKQGEDILNPGEEVTGFDRQDMRTAARNSASANVAAALGIAHSIPKVDVVLFDGSAAVAMQLAKGESLIFKGHMLVTNADTIKRYDQMESSGSQSALADLARWKVRRDDDGNWQDQQTRIRDVPYVGGNNPKLTGSIQKGLLDLQIADCLMAQMDRQPENYHIRIQGDSAEIIGIDNDMCMGKEMKNFDEDSVGSPLQRRPDLKGTYGGPPPLMSRDMYDKLKALDEEDFEAALGPEFTDDEVSAAVGRLRLLKTHADNLEAAGRVIDDFETQTVRNDAGDHVSVSDFLMKDDKLRSYVKRDATTVSTTASPLPLDLSKH